MKFNQEHIDLASELKRLGVSWEPAVGHYVYDVENLVKPDSPIQDGIYFILNYEHFMRIVGGLPRFKQSMVWLPTWEDARDVLRSLSVPDTVVQRELVRTDAFGRGRELVVLYGLIRERLAPRAGAARAAEQAPALPA